MAESLIEAYRNAKSRHTTGSVHLVCLDDDNLPETEYGALGQRTIVPRSNKEGGIKGVTGLYDRKYGKGVKRREVNMTSDGFVVESEEDNFRPDNNAAEDQELPEDPMAVLQEAILGTPATAQSYPMPAPQPGVSAMASNNPSEMMQMMQMMMQILGQNGNGHKQAEATKQAPTKPKPTTTKSVTFGGDFGKFTAPYSEARVEDGFILLATSSDQPSSYEPPVSPVTPLKVTIGGEAHLALNVGLSFEYKGDIVTIMPLKAETPDDA
jgi:hypothetical protein